ncbi:CvpA family protein [Allofournierella massiliensis]|uniref:CvpA family protein n=1 Tax=Allofournierella massiliensis TaxID=1650663 RepID=A0ABT7UMC1_9FIRM|nr:CvpA family protein [Fournierella massiliensis]MDM8200040.1 CvpA family protein [Fournierella massiliensis]
MTIANGFDLILLAILLLVAMRYAGKGIAAALVQFAGNLASLLGASIFSQNIAPVLFTSFFENNFTTSIEKTLADGGQLQLDQLVEKYAGFLPNEIQQSIIQSAGGVLTGSAPELAEQVVNQVIAPLLTPIIAIVVFFVAFALCKVIVGFVVAVLTNFNRIPILGSVNKLLGFAMGLLAGVVDLYLILCAVWAIIVVTGGSIPWLNQQVLGDSIGFSLFGQFNPFY